MLVQQFPRTWDDVVLEDLAGLRPLEELEEFAAGERIKVAVRKLEKAGVIDSNGRRVSLALPPDMTEGSTCEV